MNLKDFIFSVKTINLLNKRKKKRKITEQFVQWPIPATDNVLSEQNC